MLGIVHAQQPLGSTQTRFWSNVDNGAAITEPRVLKFRERIFVGAAVDYSSLGLFGTNTYGWLTSATGANWVARDASVAAVSEYGSIGVSGASRASDGGSVGGAIGIAGFALGDSSVAGHLGWGGYFEAIRANAATTALGLEIDVRNCAAGSVAPRPDNNGSGPHGIWIVCGPGSGAGGYGPTPINNSGAAVTVGRNEAGTPANTFQFQVGVVFGSDALTGSTGADGEATSAVAIALARGHALKWYSSDGAVKLTMGSQLDTTDVNWSMYWLGNSAIFSRNGATEDLLRMTGTAGAVNYLRIQNNVTGSAPAISAVGGDASVDLSLNPAGSGNIRFGTNTAKAAEAFASYITIKDAGGTLRKLMVCA